MIYCPICSSEVQRLPAVVVAEGGAIRPIECCVTDPAHDLATDTPEWCRDHGYPVGRCAGCAAERAEDMAS